MEKKQKQVEETLNAICPTVCRTYRIEGFFNLQKQVEETLNAICSTYSWFPILQLLLLSKQTKTKLGHWQFPSRAKYQLCKEMAKRFDLVTPFVKERQDFYRFLFRELLLRDTPQEFAEALAHETKSFPLLKKVAKDITQKGVLQWFSRWFGFPLFS